MGGSKLNNTRTDQVTMKIRVRTVMEWMMQGFMTKDIISQCINQWGVEERMCYKYIKEAKKVFVKLTQEDIKERLAFHIAARMNLYNGLEGKKTPKGAMAGLSILKDVAELEGHYLQKIDVTTQGNALHSQEIVATLILK